jgi:hypothetical protein
MLFTKSPASKVVRHLSWLLVLAVVGASGCGRQAAVVEGKVTYKGRDVSGGTLVFLGPDGKEHATVVRPNGTFRFESPVTGEVKVLYRKPDVALAKGKPPVGVAVPDAGSGLPAPPLPVKTLKKYANPTTTDLTVTITAGTHPCQLDLADVSH